MERGASFERAIDSKAIDLAERIVEMTAAAGSGHPTSATSLVHIVAILLYEHMRYDPATPEAPGADRLVLSEGHAAPVIYAAAADLGIAIAPRGGRRPMNWDDALSLRELSSPIDGHPNPAEGFPFFPAATGSLGQGLSVAAGLAIAARLDQSDERVFCVIGDGENLARSICRRAHPLALSDLPFLRAWSSVDRGDGVPSIHVLEAADAVAAWALTELAAESPAACYLRAFRPDASFVYADETPFELGGHQILREGDDLLIVAAGYMVQVALEAAEALERHGIHATLVDLYSLPFETAPVLAAAERCGGRVLSVEDNFCGGIGSAVGEVLLERGGSFELEQMFVRRVPKSARRPEELLEHLGLSTSHIVNTAVMMLEGARR